MPWTNWVRQGPLLLAAAAVVAGAAVRAVRVERQAQWTLQQSGTQASLRGLSVVSERVVWASGARGTVVRTADAGTTWRADTVPGATALDFRDVQGFSADTALVLSSGEDARVYRTTDGGRTWTLRYSNRTPGVFFDGMAFWDSRNGMAFSDPVAGKFLVISTSDGGLTWKETPPDALPAPLEGEAGYAASGTGIATAGRSHVWFGTGGGARTRVIFSNDKGTTWRTANVPMLAGADGPGIYSLTFIDTLRGAAVGGTYRQPTSKGGNAAFTVDGGRTWSAVESLPPRGYRSVIAIVPGTPAPTLIAAGPSGTDVSIDGGRTWAALTDDNFNAVAFASAAAGWAVGERGRIAKFTGMVPTVRR